MGRGDVWLRAYTWDKGALGGEGCGCQGREQPAEAEPPGWGSGTRGLA